MHKPAAARLNVRERRIKRGKGLNHGHHVAAALLTGSDCNVIPAGKAFFKALASEFGDASRRRHKDDARNAGFNGLFDNKVDFFVAYHRLDKRHVCGAFCLRSFNAMNRNPGILAFKGNGTGGNFSRTVKKRHGVTGNRADDASCVVARFFA